MWIAAHPRQRRVRNRKMSREPTTRARFGSDMGPYGIVPAWVVDAGLSPRGVQLFATLSAKWANKKAQAWPKRGVIAEKMLCSRDSVDRAIRELVDIGALTVKPRTKASGDRGANLYQLNFVKPGGRTGAHTTSPHGCGHVAARVRPRGRTDAATGTRSTEPDPRNQIIRTAPRRFEALAKDPNGDNLKVIRKLALEVRDTHQFKSNQIADFIEEVKQRCATAGIDYGRHAAVPFNVVHSACAWALVDRIANNPGPPKPRARRSAPHSRKEQ